MDGRQVVSSGAARWRKVLDGSPRVRQRQSNRAVQVVGDDPLRIQIPFAGSYVHQEARREMTGSGSMVMLPSAASLAIMVGFVRQART